MGNYRAVGAILLAVVLWALSPPIVHLTAEDANPFYFNLVVICAESGILAIFLSLGFRRYFREPVESILPDPDSKGSELKNRRTYLSYLSSAAQGESRVSLETLDRRIHSPRWKTLVSIARMPLVWAIVGTLHYGFFVWSTQHIETAVATTLYETWPFFLILFLTRHETMDKAYRMGQPIQSSRRFGIRSGDLLMLAMSAVVGAALISASRFADLTIDLTSWRDNVGILLAIIAAILHATWIAGTLVLGKAIYYKLIQPPLGTPAVACEWSSLPVERRSNEHRRLLLWLTVVGIVVARLGALPATLFVGLLVSGGQGFSLEVALTMRNLGGGILLGIVGALSAILRRLGDISATGPGVHALAFLTPPISLILLWLLGIDLPRRDLFIVGAAIIVASNILIQSRPDQHRDPSEFDQEEMPSRGRLGFNSFVLSIWAFGTLIYARDEILPQSWLEWRVGEYWGLVALSATIFALMLGFRVVRLSTRIDREDELTVALFRNCEHLVRRGLLPSEVLESLCLIDMTRTRDFIDTYASVRSRVSAQLTATLDAEDYRVLREVEIGLDQLCHVKQQGKDIVELISLSAFALVTMSIVIVSRAQGYMGSDPEWSGFVSESFSLVFVSTVAFLWVNLFDMQRDRETPTLIPILGHGGDYGILFRHNRDLRAKHFAAVFLSVAMVAVFVLLLYDKWLDIENLCGSIYRDC